MQVDCTTGQLAVIKCQTSFYATPLASHQWLLSEDIDLLPALLLPLAGPEQFGEDETEQLPLDLQFLPDDKQREPDPDLRKMLIEAIMKVCIIVP